MASAEHPMMAHRVDRRAIQAPGQSADARAGGTSFLEKESPVYPNGVSTDMRIIAFVTDAAPVKQILTRIGEPPRPPPDLARPRTDPPVR